MKKKLLFALLMPVCLFSQSSSSWIGVSNGWSDEENWTNGVPNDTLSAIIGDSCFTGVFYPDISSTSRCKSLLLDSVREANLEVNSVLYIQGDMSILGKNDTIFHNASKLTIRGDWNNKGAYVGGGTSQVVFGGSNQAISGTSMQKFNNLHLNSGSVLTLDVSIQVKGAASIFSLYGACIPQSYHVDADSIHIKNGGVLYVNTSTFEENYSAYPAAVEGAIVEYSSDSEQVVSSEITYATLKLSGGGKKLLEANLPKLLSTSSATGRIYVNEGVFDIGVYRVDRDTIVEGGYFTVADGAVLRIADEEENYFPENYKTCYLRENGVVEYYGSISTQEINNENDLLDVQIFQKEKQVVIKGRTEGTVVLIYDIHGRVVVNDQHSSIYEKTYRIPKKGVYIVVVSSKYKKRIKKMIF